jgi:hypothetical protein
LVEVRRIKARQTGRSAPLEYGGERGTEVVSGHGPLTYVRGSVTAVVFADLGFETGAALA